MYRLRYRLSLLSLSLFFFLLLPSTTFAATLRSGENVLITERLSDLYVAGQQVTIAAPIQNDLAVAGESITLQAPVSNEVFAAGRTIRLAAPIGNTLRAAGQTISISAPVKRDVILFGSMLSLDQAASISGDLIANGETILIQSPVLGNVQVNGQQVTINNTVSGNVTGHVGELILGSNAHILGNLEYTSEKRAILRDGATIGGQEQFHLREKSSDRQDGFAGIVSQFALYKLIADILISLAFVLLAYVFSERVTQRGMQDRLAIGALGFATLIIGPIVAIMLLVLLLPGVLLGLFYGVILLAAIFLSKLMLGRMILTWWYARQERIYTLDWKAAVVGPMVMVILMLIPVIGWFIGFGIFLLTLGSLTKEMLSLVSSPKETSSVRTGKPPVTTKKSSKRTR